MEDPKIEGAREEGKEELRVELILRQYNKGVPIEYIAKIYEFDLDYVNKVIANNKNK